MAHIPFFTRIEEPPPVGVRWNPGWYSSMMRASDSQAQMNAAIIKTTGGVNITKGFLKRWTWRSFENTATPQSTYPLMAAHELNSDLAWCQSNGMKLIVMIEDITYGYQDNSPNPDYLEPYRGINYTPGADATFFASNVTGASWTLSTTVAPSAVLVTIRGDSAVNHSAKTALITGTTAAGGAQTETVALPNGSDIVTSTKSFKTVTSVVPSASIGTSTMDIGSTSRKNGYAMARWDSYVHARWKLMLTAFAVQFGDHPALEGVMHEESSPTFASADLSTPPAGQLYEPYNAVVYRDALIDEITHWRSLRPDIRWFASLNFMPGTGDAFDGTYLNQVVLAHKPNVVIFCQDAEESNAALENRTFWIYRDNKATCPICANLSTQVYTQSPAPTGEQMYQFATADLGANYITPVFQGASNTNWTNKIVPTARAHPTFNVEDWT